MERLLVLRHAQAEDHAESDRDRPLDRHGLAQAVAIAAWIAREAPPTRIVSSPALRAWQTAEALRDACGAPLVEESGLYQAGIQDMLRVADRHGDTHTLVLVGHNPACEALASLLAAQDGQDIALRPAGVAGFAVTGDLPQQAVLLWRAHPDELDGLGDPGAP